ncbi:hypothetical protein L596_019373 [Steinernema carpocapsae]|uniref:Uncharacterized protein n=1 Tax=Steinernema carpocapsae TaxID=34508 RepID=A0A4U5MQI3_STECR|nr:hypothetical protein L596_019373 [Steinernema carpocapsae]
MVKFNVCVFLCLFLVANATLHLRGFSLMNLGRDRLGEERVPWAYPQMDSDDEAYHEKRARLLPIPLRQPYKLFSPTKHRAF